MSLADKIKGYQKIPIRVKASLWYTVCNILQKGISFFVVPIYVRILTTAEYGKYSVFQSWRDILIIFATLNLYCGVFTKAMVVHEEDRDRYTSSIQALSSMLTAAMLVIYLLAGNTWNRLLSMDSATVLLLFAYFIFYPAFTFWSVRQRVENKYVTMTIATILVSVATPVISICLLLFTNLRERSVIWGYLIVQSAIGAVFYIYHFWKGRCLFVWAYWKDALKFNLPLVPHYLSVIVLGQADRIMIQAYCGDEKAGIYNLAYQISLIMNVFINAINNTLVPWSYEKLKNQQFDHLKHIAKNICLVIAAMTLGVVLVAPEAIRILGTAEYMEAIWVVPTVALSVYFTFCYSLFSTISFYYGATHFVMIASVVGAGLNVILNMLFIPIFGFIAAGYTTMFCYLMFMVMHYVFMQVVCKRHGITKEIYDNRFIALSCVVSCLLSAGFMCLYGTWWIRYLIVFAVLIGIYLNRGKILDLLKEVRR